MKEVHPRGEAGNPRSVWLLICLALVAFALWPATAAPAASPSVTSVTARVDYGVDVQWTLPAGMKAYSIEIAADPETYAEGHGKGSFLGENLAHTALLLHTPGATSWTGPELPFGTYYVHVSAFDGLTCSSPLGLGCPKEWSETVAFTAPQRDFRIRLNLLGGGREPYISWDNRCCLSVFDIGLLEIATDPDVYADGPFEGLFLEENLVLAESPPFTTQESYTSSRPLAGGTYYLHAVGVDRRFCPTDDPTRLMCRDEVSKPLRFTVAPTPPVLLSAEQAGGVIELAWSLPFGMYSDFVEVATAPDVYSSGLLRGAFRDENLVLFDDSLFPRERSYTAPEPLAPGTYYAHIAAYVSGSCTPFVFPPGCFDEYSNVARITIPAPAVPETTPAPAALSSDNVTRFSLLRARNIQSVRSISVQAAVDEEASVLVAGHVRVSGTSRRFKLRPVKRAVKPGRPVKLRIRLGRRALPAVLRAIRQRRRVSARLTITAQDRAGNKTAERRTIRLRR